MRAGTRDGYTVDAREAVDAGRLLEEGLVWRIKKQIYALEPDISVVTDK